MAMHDLAPGPANPRNSEGDTSLLADGRLLLVWTRFEGREDHATAALWAMSSSNLGQTWGDQRLLLPAAEAQQNVMSVSLLREGASGHLLLSYLCKNGPDDLQVRVRRSEDEARNWSEPALVSVEGGYNVMNNARVVQLTDGRLVAPVSRSNRLEPGRRQVGICYLSDDGGRTWRASSGRVAFDDASPCQEPGIVPLPDGSGLLMYIRTDRGHVYRSLSSDDAETWSPPEPLLDLPAPMAPATMLALPDHRLVAFYSHREDGRSAGWADRTPLAVAWSADGLRWQRLPDLEPDPEYCYGYTSARLYGETLVLSYYVWPRSSPQHFEGTSLRVRALSLSALGLPRTGGR